MEWRDPKAMQRIWKKLKVTREYLYHIQKEWWRSICESWHTQSVDGRNEISVVFISSCWPNRQQNRFSETQMAYCVSSLPRTINPGTVNYIQNKSECVFMTQGNEDQRKISPGLSGQTERVNLTLSIFSPHCLIIQRLYRHLKAYWKLCSFTCLCWRIIRM